MSWGALVGAGLSIMGGMKGAKDAAKANKANLAKIEGIYNQGYTTAYGNLMQGIQSAQAGKESALYALGKQTGQASKKIQKGGKQADSSAQAALKAKGLGNTTLGVNASNQVAANVAEAEAGLAADAAGVAANIEQTTAAAVTQGYAALADLATWKAGGLAGILGGVQHKSGSNGLWGLAGDFLGGVDWGSLSFGGDGGGLKTEGGSPAYGPKP